MENFSGQILREWYQSRALSRDYSLRSFARDIGMSHSYVSLVFRNKKRLPPKTLRQVAERLGIELPELASERPKPKRQHEFSELELERFRLMARWYHIALLELAEITSFPFSSRNAADYFGVGIEAVQEALISLKRLGLMQNRGDRWAKAESRLSIVSPVSVEAIRAYHRQMIANAFYELTKTDERDFKKRDITGITMPINPKRIAGAKKRIAQFRRSLEAYLTQGECTEVYQLNFQLFPLRGAGKNEARSREKE